MATKLETFLVNNPNSYLYIDRSHGFLIDIKSKVVSSRRFNRGECGYGESFSRAIEEFDKNNGTDLFRIFESNAQRTEYVENLLKKGFRKEGMTLETYGAFYIERGGVCIIEVGIAPKDIEEYKRAVKKELLIPRVINQTYALIDRGGFYAAYQKPLSSSVFDVEQ